MTIHEGPQHERTAAANDSGAEVRKSYASRFEPDALVAALVGLVTLIMGLIVIVRGGFSGAMSDPVVKVLGFTHTTTLGLIEIGIGAGLLISAVNRSRSEAMFFGGVLGIAGFVGAVQASSFRTSLALESSMGWLAAIVGLVVVLAALLLPRFSRHSTVVQQHVEQG